MTPRGGRRHTAGQCHVIPTDPHVHCSAMSSLWWIHTAKKLRTELFERRHTHTHHTHTHTHTHKGHMYFCATISGLKLSFSGEVHDYCHGDGSVEGHNVHQVSQHHPHNLLYVGNSKLPEHFKNMFHGNCSGEGTCVYKFHLIHTTVNNF